MKCVEGVFVHISYTFLNDSFLLLVLEVFDLAASASNQVRADLLSQWCRDGGILIISYSLFRIIVSYRGRSRRLKSIFNESLINPGEGKSGCQGGAQLEHDSAELGMEGHGDRRHQAVIVQVK